MITVFICMCILTIFSLAAWLFCKFMVWKHHDPNPIPMKRYLVFAYPAYYPGGGWTDFQGSFASSQEAFNFVAAYKGEQSGGIEIIDLETEQDIYVYPQHREGYFA